MREQLKFRLVRTKEEFDGLSEFARTFDHHVGPGSILPIYTVERGQQMIGYFNVVAYPILGPAFHPGVGTAREFFEAVQYVKNHFCMSSIDNNFRNGTCFMALRPDMKPVLKRALEHCGFKNTNKELWQAIP